MKKFRYTITQNQINIPFFVITFDTNGGDSLPVKQVFQNSSMPALPTPTRQYFEFEGWYADEALQEEIPQTVTSDITLYARWLKLFTVSFNSQGGTAVESQIVIEGLYATQPSLPAREGYEFINWLYQDTIFDFENTPITENIELTAQWQSISTFLYISGLYEGGNIKKFTTNDYSLDSQTGVIRQTTATVINSMVSDDNYLYASQVSGDSGILKFDITNMQLVSRTPIGFSTAGSAFAQNGQYKLSIDNDYIYSDANFYMYKTDKNTMLRVQRIGDGSSQQFSGMYVDNDYLYTIERISASLQKRNKTDISVVIQSNNSADVPSNTIRIIGDDTHLYMSDLNNSVIKKFLKSDLSYIGATQVYSGGVQIDSFDIDDTHIYVGGADSPAFGDNGKLIKYLKSNLSFVAEVEYKSIYTINANSYGDHILSIALGTQYVYVSSFDTIIYNKENMSIVDRFEPYTEGDGPGLPIIRTTLLGK
jgi:uncharacterized repeat protein (TIGR02543 family)